MAAAARRHFSGDIDLAEAYHLRTGNQKMQRRRRTFRPPSPRDKLLAVRLPALTAATAAATAITAATAAAAAADLTPTATALALRTSFVYVQRTAVQFRSVQLWDSRFAHHALPSFRRKQSRGAGRYHDRLRH